MTTLNQPLTTSATTQEFMQEKREFKIHWGWITGIFVIGALIWMISPADPIPDVIIGLGWIDDVLVACIPVVTGILKVKQLITDARNS